MRRRFLSPAALLAVATSAAAVAAIQPERLTQKGGELHWSGPQFIQADSEGRVFLLRGDDLTVYPILRDHQLGTPSKLPLAADGAPLRDAAMNARREWLLLLGTSVRLATPDEAESAPALEWMPLAVGFVEGDPVAVVSAQRMSRRTADQETPEAPWLARWSGDDWTAEALDPATSKAADPNAVISDRGGLVLGDRNGRYFLARQYSYRVEARRRAAAQATQTLAVGPAKVQERPAKPGEEAAFTAGLKPAEGARAGVFRGMSAILALSKTPGGDLLVLTGPAVAGEGRCGLDRVDWTAGRVVRVGLDLACPGRMSLAAGRDGLYLAPFNGKDDRYFVAWEALEAAHWEPVEGAIFSD